jgi:hypothetical protein
VYRSENLGHARRRDHFRIFRPVASGKSIDRSVRIELAQQERDTDRVDAAAERYPDASQIVGAAPHRFGQQISHKGYRFAFTSDLRINLHRCELGAPHQSAGAIEPRRPGRQNLPDIGQQRSPSWQRFRALQVLDHVSVHFALRSWQLQQRLVLGGKRQATGWQYRVVEWPVADIITTEQDLTAPLINQGERVIAVDPLKRLCPFFVEKRVDDFSWRPGARRNSLLFQVQQYVSRVVDCSVADEDSLISGENALRRLSADRPDGEIGRVTLNVHHFAPMGDRVPHGAQFSVRRPVPDPEDRAQF